MEASKLIPLLPIKWKTEYLVILQQQAAPPDLVEGTADILVVEVTTHQDHWILVGLADHTNLDSKGLLELIQLGGFHGRRYMHK